jgi:hypothetical protein
MRTWNFSLAAALGMASLPGAALATVDIRVDLSSQTMDVSSSSGDHYTWPVSTARKGFRTPRGTYGVQSMAPMHYSRKYYNSPMPHSIFFHGGYAIHGSYETASLGRAASHGCIRLSPAHAAVLYGMVATEGARITITGSNPDRFAGVSGGHTSGRFGRAAPDDSLPDGEDVLVPAAPASDGWSVDPGDDSF